MSTVRIHNHGPEAINVVDGNGQVTTMGEGGNNLFVTPIQILELGTPAQITEIAPQVPQLPADAHWPFQTGRLTLADALADTDGTPRPDNPTVKVDPFADAPAMKTDDLGPGTGQTGEADANAPAVDNVDGLVQQ